MSSGHSSKDRADARGFMFATGIENSYPVVTAKDGSNLRVDELEKTGFYGHWRDDLRLTKETGIRYLRFGPQYYQAHRGPGRYDWEFADETFAELRRLEIVPIVDLCHFGMPDWTGNFQNPEWPELFAEYARAFAERYEWVELFTPVNEIYTNAMFSAKHGWWNERLKSDRSFVTALKNMCKANLLAEEEILKVRPQAIFIQSEATSFFHERSPRAIEQARFENERRFLSLDLSYGHEVSSLIYEFLQDNGMSQEEYHWLLEHGKALHAHCIMGTDYYSQNEHWVKPDGKTESSGVIFGYAVLARHYFDRYHLPIMLTETNNRGAEEAPHWLWRAWAEMRGLKRNSVPIMGFTWYSLLDQVDWDTALREDNGHVNPIGLYDLDRRPRDVGNSYRELIAEWSDEAPVEGLSLSSVKLVLKAA